MIIQYFGFTFSESVSLEMLYQLMVVVVFAVFHLLSFRCF